MKMAESSRGDAVRESRARTVAERLVAVVTVATLAGCAAIAPQYYTLVTPQPPFDAAPPVESDYAISVQPVMIPEQVARPQIVVRASAGAEVVPLNAALWVAPLESQIRTVLSDALSRELNVLDLSDSRAAGGLPVWQIFLDVNRFESLYDMSVRQEVVWRVVPQGMPASVKQRVCSAELEVPVATGMSALVEGHSLALRRVAGLLAESLPSRPSDGAAGPTASQSQGAATGALTVAASGLYATGDHPPSVQFRGCAG